MAKFRIAPVSDSATEKAFFQVQHLIYAGDNNWVCPLNEEIAAIFDADKNSFFNHGEAIRWVMYDDKNKLVGRVAAFINRKKASNYEVPVGGMGFFECINSQEAANTLFDTCKDWLSKHGMQAMDGPINFSENDNFWGLLVDGYTQPAYGMPYNLPYYATLFENYGFRLFFNQISNELSVQSPLPERFAKISEWVTKKEAYNFKWVDHNDLGAFAKAFQSVYNDAWQFHENFTAITDGQLQKYIEKFKHVAISAFLPYVTVQDEPAGFIVCLPDLNQIFKPLKGKFSILDKILFKWRSRNEFEWYRKRGILTRGRVVVMGVKPKFQKYGIESGLIFSSVQAAKEMGFQSIELSWVGDFNPKMRDLHESTGAYYCRTHRTFRVRFDGQDWNRSAIIPVDTRDKRSDT